MLGVLGFQRLETSAVLALITNARRVRWEGQGFPCLLSLAACEINGVRFTFQKSFLELCLHQEEELPHTGAQQGCTYLGCGGVRREVWGQNEVWSGVRLWAGTVR